MSQNPGRESRRAYLALFVIVAGVAVAFVTLPANTVAIIAPFGLVGAISTLAVGYIKAEEARGRARMERGEGVVTRWTLDAAQWQEFVRLNQGTINLPQIEDKARTSSASAIDVIFAEDAVYVAGQYYMMDRHWGTKATREPAYIELLQYGLEDLTPLRIPIPASCQEASKRVAEYFNAPL